MAITIKRRATMKGDRTGLASSVNSIISEIQAIFNRIGVTRYTISDPESDYLMLDASNEKLYLRTIEGKTYEISLTEVV